MIGQVTALVGRWFGARPHDAPAFSMFPDAAQGKHEKVEKHVLGHFWWPTLNRVPRPELNHLMQSPRPDLDWSTTLMTWRDRAACLGQDPELFFPDGNSGPALLQTEEAKAVCRRCEVAETCLKWALESGQEAGVWGGLSEGERLALKRRNGPFRRAS